MGMSVVGIILIVGVIFIILGFVRLIAGGFRGFSFGHATLSCPFCNEETPANLPNCQHCNRELSG